MRKYASLEVLEAWRQAVPGDPASGERRIIKAAHRVEFDYEPRPGYLYVRSRMISSRTNDNHDTFPAGEIEQGYKTFLGKPVFVNHHNANHRRARGVIVAVALHRDRNPDGSPDTWAEGLMEVDAVKFPKLCKAILAGRVNRTSMGVDVEWSKCSACGNKATSPAEYCKHLPAMKGKKIRQRNMKTGKVEETLIHEICAGLSFFENSLLVEDPADPTAYLLGKPDARGMDKAASRKTASAQDMRSFDQLQPHERASVAQYHPQMVEEGNAHPGSTPHDYLYESRQEPRDEFLGRYMDGDEEFRREYGPGDWEAHHAETLAAHPVPRYPAENRWPLIVSDSNPNYVDDGYHRMHSYMRDGATEIPTVRMHPRTAANDSSPDFRDYFGNTCRDCGDPVKYTPARGGSFRHDGMRNYDHPASPVDPDDRSRGMNPSTFGGTHCLVCGDQAKVNLHALDKPGGGWHHADGMRRDHPVLPADPQGVYDSVPGIRAQYDQARSRMGDHMHSLFEQLEGGPVPRRPRGDEHLMPPDPFTAAKTAVFTANPDHCASCGHPFTSPYTSPAAGDWQNQGMPFLCNDCAIGHFGTGTAEGKPPPARYHGPGGTELNPLENEYGYRPEGTEATGTRPWTPDDAPLQSQSARKPKKSYPRPVKGYGNDPRFDGVSLKRDRNGFYVHTRASRSDSYPTAEDIPEADINDIRATGAKAAGGDHPWFRANPVSSHHIVSSYLGASDDERALGDRWYSDAHHIAKIIGKGDSALGAGLLSAYSPRTAWPVNMFNASRASRGDPPGPGTGAMGMHQKPALRILGGEHHSKVLTAPKTAAFAHLIEHGGDTEADEKNGTQRVVIDRHAMSVAVGRRLTDADKESMPIGQAQHYKHVERAYHEAAHVISGHLGRKVSPHQVQAATWLHQIRKNSEEDSSGAKGAGGKGRVQMGQNSRTRWVEHHHEHHPGHIPEENMHYHGALEDYPESGTHCAECGRRFGDLDDNPAGSRPTAPSRLLPHLCTDCGERHLQGDDLSVGRQPADPDEPRFPGRYRAFDYPAEGLRTSQSALRTTAYGETRVPPQVDTLRMDECPVCGEHNVWSGSRCPVCGFVVPPSVFRDPDTSKAQEVRDQLDSSGDVTLPPDAPDAAQPGALPTAQVGSGEDADEQLIHPDQIAPDGVPTVQGGGDADFDAEDDAMVPPGQEDPEAQAEAEEDPGLAEAGTAPEDEEDPGQDMYAEELVCPACGTTFEADAAAQPGVPCPACGMAALHPVGEDEDGGDPMQDEEDPGDPRKEQEDPSDPDAQPGDEKDEEDEDKDMPESKTAAAVARAQARRIAELTAQNDVLHAQLSFLARAAGVDREFDEIGRRVMRHHADILNPGSPVPDPPQGPPSQTTEEALAPEAMDNAGRPGTTPGANSRVPAAQTTTAITPGVEMQTPPATNLVDVTAPVQGTNPSQDGGVPLSQRRIETDVRIDPNPLKANGPGIGGQGDNGSAFPWVLDARMPGQGGQQGQGQGQGQLSSAGEADASRRTFASIRLAKMRVQAGLAQGEELTVAEHIERDASLPTAMIEHEIGVLSRVPAVQQQAPRPMQRAASRAVPSLVSVGASQYAPAVAGYDDDASDLFD